MSDNEDAEPPMVLVYALIGLIVVFIGAVIGVILHDLYQATQGNPESVERVRITLIMVGFAVGLPTIGWITVKISQNVKPWIK